MNRTEIENTLAAAEATMAEDGALDVKTLGFWRAVGAVKRDAAFVEEFADRIAVIDRRAFEQWALLTIPFMVGTVLAVLGTLGGLAVIASAYYVDDPLAALLLIAGTGVLMVALHGLGHVVVGRAAGMRFTHWFIGTIARPQPGVKVDYATYLRTPARDRARMHAAGAVVTKAVPFVMLGAAWGMGAPWWAWAALLLIGTGSIATDVLWSTKSSDWKKYAREMRYAA